MIIASKKAVSGARTPLLGRSGPVLVSRAQLFASHPQSAQLDEEQRRVFKAALFPV